MNQNSLNIDQTFEVIKQKYEEVLNLCVNKKTITIGNKKPFNGKIRNLIKFRQKLKKYGKSSEYFDTKYQYLTKQIEIEICEYESKQIL